MTNHEVTLNRPSPLNAIFFSLFGRPPSWLHGRLLNISHEWAKCKKSEGEVKAIAVVQKLSIIGEKLILFAYFQDSGGGKRPLCPPPADANA